MSKGASLAPQEIKIDLAVLPGANHTDLYDQIDVIPFGKLKAFFEEYLK